MPVDELVVELVVELVLPVLIGGSVPVEPEPVVVPEVPPVVPVPVLPELLVCVKAGGSRAHAMAAIVIDRNQIRGDIPPSCGLNYGTKTAGNDVKLRTARQRFGECLFSTGPGGIRGGSRTAAAGRKA